jgi:hypothetical protein
LTFADLERAGFTGPALDAIKLLTHNDGSNYPDYIKRIKTNPMATKIKLADLAHNSNPTRGAVSVKKNYPEAIRILSDV